MVNINSESFFINLWNTFPHPSFVISKNFKIINLNSAVEILFMTSKKKLQEKKINDFVDKGSLLLKVINQSILNQAPVVIYDIDIYWWKKDVERFNVYSSPLEGSAKHILLVMNINPKKDRIDKKLLHQNAARSVSGLSAMLAHEIRNPSTRLSSFWN